jgi:hypothetical protein
MGFTIYDLRLTRKQTRLDKNETGVRFKRESVKIVRLLVACICLLFLCSCATEQSVHRSLPADVPINRDAGRGGFLVVTVQLEDGQKLPMILDTGAGGTLFAKSLEPKLGKPLGTNMANWWGAKITITDYAAPKLYLEGAPLMMTGTIIDTCDHKSLLSLNGRPIMGILGMDVLEHYCIQLDFAAGKMRFLDGGRADKRNWGRAFPIVALNDEDLRPAVGENLLGMQDTYSVIDTGFDSDGWLRPKYFQQWTNAAVLPTNGETHWPNGMFGGEKYPFVSLRGPDVESDGIGLRFLARHLVTLDFPNHTLYLKRTSIRPLADERAAAVVSYLKDLKEEGQLPGWSKDEHGKSKGVKFHFGFNSATVEAQKNDDSSVYHYTVIRASGEDPWKLQKAWRTDAKGRVVEEYPVP